MVTLSIIIPCYNRSDLVSQLVRSIPERNDIEVILVDDYSVEDLSRIDLTAFPHHKYIRNDTESRYAGSARNIGIANSSGEYLFFADSDDLIIPDGFVKCLEILKKEKQDVLFAKATSFRDIDGSIGTRHIRANWLVDEVLNGANQTILVRFATPWAKFIRKDFIEEHHLRFEKQRVSNDIVFAAQLVCNRPVIIVCDEVIYSIRQGNSALTNDFALENTEVRLQALIRYNEVLTGHGLRYLMAPALPLICRLLQRAPNRVIYWMIVFFARRQPVLFTGWTLQNIWRRRRER